MKALTLTQPYATLVTVGAKKIETRGWKTSFRGPLAIHAAKGFPGEAKRFCEARMVCRALGWPECPTPLTQEWMDESKRLINSLPLGKVIVTCNLVDVVRTQDFLCQEGVFDRYPELFTEQEQAFGNYEEGRYGWILEDVKMLPDPDPVKGALSLWEWDDAHYWKMREDFGPYGDATTPGFFAR